MIYQQEMLSCSSSGFAAFRKPTFSVSKKFHSDPRRGTPNPRRNKNHKYQAGVVALNWIACGFFVGLY